MSSQFTLMQEQRFRPFFLTQFLGAFNDNVFKTALITLVVFHASSLSDIDSVMLATILPGLFILPFFLFSATAGQIADKFEKSRIMRYVKMFEIALMLFASAGFFLNNIALLGAALFMMGMHSTLFGPVKYAYLPQHLTENELVGGNGMVEMGTFAAILLGQVLGASLAVQTNHALLTSIATITIAMTGYWISCEIPDSPAAEASLKINWNPITEIFHNLKFAWRHQVIWLALIAISWFWFYGATLLAQFPSFAKNVLKGDESVFILLLTVFSTGIGLGSLLCEKLSKDGLGLGLVVFGGIGLSLSGADLYFTSNGFPSAAEIQNYSQLLGRLQNWRLLFDIALIGLFGGLYIVPLYALIQTRAEKSHQSRVIAANNILNALFMVAAAGFSLFLFKQGFNIPQLFLATALLNMFVIVYLCIRQPEYYKAFIACIKFP
ncbi:MAG: MFS transporter [Methylotenera sp.]|nr:MFS transporter [Methylotenera sp.]